ncbi:MULTISPECIES: hypothetical protein [unclassified Afipia]|uniref:hypothetical protein n=1 Tax=unclassified Afipia TaxID=2642050 RepID=UPI001267E377|nr:MULTISPECIES: hypothetical protein [unclassified Afipia]
MVGGTLRPTQSELSGKTLDQQLVAQKQLLARIEAEELSTHRKTHWQQIRLRIFYRLFHPRRLVIPARTWFAHDLFQLSLK